MFIHEGAAARRRTVRKKKGGGNKEAEQRQRRESLILLPLVLVHACRCEFACARARARAGVPCVKERAGREAEKVCRCTQMCHSSEKSLSNGGQEDYGSVKTYTTFTHSQIFLPFFSARRSADLETDFFFFWVHSLRGEKRSGFTFQSEFEWLVCFIEL